MLYEWLIAATLLLPPPVAEQDVMRFPLSVVKENLALACDHVAWLEEKCEQEPYFREQSFWWYTEAVQAKAAWQALADATWAYRPLDRLEELREIIGWAAYAQGRMPSPVPLHYCGKVW